MPLALELLRLSHDVPVIRLVLQLLVVILQPSAASSCLLSPEDLRRVKLMVQSLAVSHTESIRELAFAVLLNLPTTLLNSWDECLLLPSVLSDGSWPDDNSAYRYLRATPLYIDHAAMHGAALIDIVYCARYSALYAARASSCALFSHGAGAASRAVGYIIRVTNAFFLGETEVLPAAYPSVLLFLSRCSNLSADSTGDLVQTLRAAQPALDDRMVSNCTLASEETCRAATDEQAKLLQALNMYVAWGMMRGYHLTMTLHDYFLPTVVTCMPVCFVAPIAVHHFLQHGVLRRSDGERWTL